MDDADDGKFEEGNARESPVLDRRLAACDGCIAEGPEDSMDILTYWQVCSIILTILHQFYANFIETAQIHLMPHHVHHGT